MFRNLASSNRSVEAGGVYRCYGAGTMIETAEVIEVGRDIMGIPHVRFQVWVTRGAACSAVERRTLALDVFSARYRERVAA